MLRKFCVYIKKGISPFSFSLYIYFIGDVMKKIFIIVLLLFLICPLNILAKDMSKSSIVMDVDSGRIIYKNNIHEKHLIASITKIMTCIVVLENANLEDKIVVGEEVLKMYGTNIYLEVGEEITIKDLLYGLMLRSGNDAAVVLATNIFGYDKFISLMNETAKKIGMNDTIFFNPHGLDEDTKNYSTAYDMAILGRYAFQNKIYRTIISTKKYTTKSSLKSYVWYNRMSLLSRYSNCIGGKNGYTPKAGKTLVSYAKKDDTTLMIVSLNDSSIYENHEKLYNSFFSKYKTYEILNKDKFSKNSNILGQQVMIKNSFSYLLKENELDDVETLLSIYSNSNSKRLGKVIIKFQNKKIGEVPIYAKSFKKKESFFKKLKNLFIR